MVQRKNAIAEFIAASDDNETVIEFDTETGHTSANKTDYEKRLDDILDSLNNEDDAEVAIYRQPFDGKSKMVFLTSFSPDKYSPAELLVFLRDNYGSGDYRVMVRVNGRIKANKLLSVEAPKTAETATGNQSEIAQVLSVVMARQDQLFDMLQKREAPSEDAMLDRLMKYRDLFGGGGVVQQSNPLSQVKETLEMLDLMGVQIGGKDEDDGFTGLLEKLTPLVQYGMTQSNPTHKPQQNNPEKEKEKMRSVAQNLKLQMGVSMLLGMAKRNTPPSAAADAVMDQVSKDDLEILLNSGDYVTNLAQINTEVEKYREWFTMLGDEIKKTISPNGTN